MSFDDPRTENARRPLGSDDACYRAMLTRDRRYEGEFIIGVVTTGIYCRPGCPARMPKRENVRFFSCAAAAEHVGLRPCLRCRPDATANVAVWRGTSTTVSRALRLIGEGALHGSNVEALADRLGVGARHLRRLFHRHLGASPKAIAQSERLHFARKLLDETTLPMTEIAHAAGFDSVRRFNDAMRRTFGRPPTALRTHKNSLENDERDVIVLRVPHRTPLAWDALLSFLAARATPFVERVHDGVYARTVSVGRVHGIVEVRRAPTLDALVVRLRLRGRADLLPLLARVRRVFDLDSDPSRIDAHLRADPLLRASVDDTPGLRVPGAWDGFELAVRAILGQQVTVRGATTLAGRLVSRFGRAIDSSDDVLTHAFPTPAVLAAADLRVIGLPAARAAAISALSAAVVSGAIDLDAWPTLDEGLARLTALSGIGPWTAQYIAMRAAHEPDAFPAGDLILRRALSPSGRTCTTAEAEERASRFRPFRAYAAMHLWRSARVSIPERPSRMATQSKTKGIRK